VIEHKALVDFRENKEYANEFSQAIHNEKYLQERASGLMREVEGLQCNTPFVTS